MTRGLSPPPTRGEQGGFAWTAWFIALYRFIRPIYAVNTATLDPTSSEIPEGYWAIYNNTTTNVVKLWTNIGGTMKSVTLT